MPSAIYYVQECPTCGRNLQVRVEYLGKKVSCQHCAASFLAVDPASGHSDASNSGASLLAKVEELLNTDAHRALGVGSAGMYDS